jgi:hypothetical protein
MIWAPPALPRCPKSRQSLRKKRQRYLTQQLIHRAKPLRPSTTASNIRDAPHVQNACGRHPEFVISGIQFPCPLFQYSCTHFPKSVHFFCLAPTPKKRGWQRATPILILTTVVHRQSGCIRIHECNPEVPIALLSDVASELGYLTHVIELISERFG